MISILIFIMYNTALKIMSVISRHRIETKHVRVILGISAVFALFFAINPAFAQESVDVSEQITLSKDLQNNPLAQDILKKIEQTKKND